MPPRLRQAGDEPLVHRIDNGWKDDGNRPAGVLCRPDCWRALGQDDIHLEVDEFSRQRGKALILPLRRAVLQGDTVALHIPEIAEPLAEGLVDGGGGVGVKGASQNPDPWRLRPRLRVGGGWCQDEAEDEREERKRCHWITSSAWKRRVGGIVRPSALAVFRLRTSAYLVGTSTGKSAGLVPFRRRSTKYAKRR